MDAPEAKRRYAEKVKICGQDPYSIPTVDTEVPLNVNFQSIYKFMVLDSNPFTGKAKDSSRGMEANLWYQQGWVKKVSGKKLGNIFVVHGQVLHSFNLRQKPLNPWLIIEDNGCVLAAHCDCAIGLLETCSHIGAILYALEDIEKKVAAKEVCFSLFSWYLK